MTKTSIKKEEEICDKYSEGISIENIAIHSNLDKTTVRRVLKRNNIKFRAPYATLRKYPLDETLFDKIDTEEKAYFLGFFIADGFHNEKAHQLIITINNKDVEILNRFNQFIYNGKYIIKEMDYEYQKNTSPTVRIQLNSKIISKKFIEYGIRQKKSFSAELPSCIPDNLFNHFVRGLFDGDGHISKSAPPEKSGQSQKFCAGITSSISLNKELADRLKSLGFNFRSYSEDRHSQPMLKIQIQGNRRTRLFLEWLYRDANIFLSRKYNRYLELLETISDIDCGKGYQGYYYCKAQTKNPYLVLITRKGKVVYRESFPSKELAQKAYSENKIKISKDKWRENS